MAVTHRAFGSALRAARDDEIAAAAFGKAVLSLKVRAIAATAAGAGLAGSMYAHFVSYIDPTSFGFPESVYVLSMVVIGGAGTRLGPLFGAALLLVAPEALRFVGASTAVDANLRQICYGLLLVGFAFLRPQGIAGAGRRR